ncbi:MAG: hypothetical protein P8O70_05070, partial [SAR324 cluster bacterium]|nr:hypothetical protein [SAR324 cluster bacterium]
DKQYHLRQAFVANCANKQSDKFPVQRISSLTYPLVMRQHANFLSPEKTVIPTTHSESMYMVTLHLPRPFLHNVKQSIGAKLPKVIRTQEDLVRLFPMHIH